MRVLVVAAGPLAASGYATRIRSMVSAYTDRHWGVDLVHLAREGEDTVSADLQTKLAAYIPVRLPPVSWKHHLSRLPPMARVVADRTTGSLRGPYDLAQGESSAVWPIVQRAPAARRLIVFHDDDATRLRRLARQTGDPLRKAVRTATSVKYAGLQRALIRRVDRIWFVSAVEQDRVDPQHENSLLVPNGADSAFFETDSRPAAEPVVMFIGPAAYDANSGAAAHYVARIHPLVRRAVPNAQLWLVGRGWAHLARQEDGVVDRGFVADLPAELERAAVVVAPLLAGSGTKIKVIEAMAAARPIVASAVAAEGIPPSSGLRVRDDPKAFASAVVELLQAPGVRLSSAEANRLAVSSLEWPSIWSKAIADIARHVPAARDSATLDQ